MNRAAVARYPVRIEPVQTVCVLPFLPAKPAVAVARAFVAGTAKSDPDFPVGHPDLAYSAEQFSSTVSATDLADIKTLFNGAADFSSLCFSAAAPPRLPPEAVFRWS
jgi:hypothetical protein